MFAGRRMADIGADGMGAAPLSAAGPATGLDTVSREAATVRMLARSRGRWPRGGRRGSAPGVG